MVVLNNADIRPLVHAVVGVIRKSKLLFSNCPPSESWERQDSQFLIAERPEGKSYAGQWEFPGGKVEGNETGLQALKRELYEELGIRLTQATHWYNHTHPYPEKVVLLELWFVDAFSGDPYGKENQSLLWATLSEIEHLNILEGNIPIIDRLKKHEGNEQ